MMLFLNRLAWLYAKRFFCIDVNLREPLKIHFGRQANLFVAGLRQTKGALSTDKSYLSSLPDNKNFLLATQKQLLELPLMNK